MRVTSFTACLGLLCHSTIAVSARQNTTDPVTQLVQNLQVISESTSVGINNALESQQFEEVIRRLQSISPIEPSTPQTVEGAVQRLQAANATHPATLYEYIANLRALNLIDTVDSLLSFAKGLAAEEGSSFNNNAPPPVGIFPKKLSCDAPYSISEDALRSAIYIPAGFTYGKKPPVILFPGTGDTGYTTFKGNFIPLLQDTDFADPVWINVPNLLLDDAQINAEYAAYAINYISAICDTNVTVAAWSQGNIDVQWAFKFWPSTRLVTTDHIALSPDYAGTVLANFISPPEVPLPPSVLQQRYLQSSDFITILRADDGDSGYVPTTTIYSGFFDEIVEPQQGTVASGFLKDARGVGVTNHEVQQVCAGQLAGTFYTHEGILYNPLSFALLRDAMQNDGPGQVERLDLSSICSQYLTPGLDLGDLLVTENVLAIAGLGILLYNPKTLVEPSIKRYARSLPVADPGQCQSTTTTLVTTMITSTTKTTMTDTSTSVMSMSTISQSSTSTGIGTTTTSGSTSNAGSSGSVTTNTSSTPSVITRTTTSSASLTSNSDRSTSAYTIFTSTTSSTSITAGTTLSPSSSMLSTSTTTDNSISSVYFTSTFISSPVYTMPSTTTINSSPSIVSVYPTATLSPPTQSVSSASLPISDSSTAALSTSRSQTHTSSAQYSTLSPYSTAVPPISSDSTAFSSTIGQPTVSTAPYISVSPTTDSLQVQPSPSSSYDISQSASFSQSSSVTYSTATAGSVSSSYEAGSTFATVSTHPSRLTSPGSSTYARQSTASSKASSTNRGNALEILQSSSATRTEGLPYSSVSTQAKGFPVTVSPSTYSPLVSQSTTTTSETSETLVTPTFISPYADLGSHERGRVDLSLLAVLATLMIVYIV